MASLYLRVLHIVARICVSNALENMPLSSYVLYVCLVDCEVAVSVAFCERMLVTSIEHSCDKCNKGYIGACMYVYL
jgi:hypothetical protein